VNAIELLTIGASDAETYVALACGKAEELGLSVSVAVYGNEGRMKAFRRMDGAPLLSIDSSQRKAYTAVATGAPTATLFEAFTDAPAMLGQVGELEGIVVLGGGVPLYAGDKLVGALGVAGGSAEQDAEIAAAVAATAGA